MNWDARGRLSPTNRDPDHVLAIVFFPPTYDAQMPFLELRKTTGHQGINSRLIFWLGFFLPSRLLGEECTLWLVVAASALPLSTSHPFFPGLITMKSTSPHTSFRAYVPSSKVHDGLSAIENTGLPTHNQINQAPRAPLSAFFLSSSIPC